MSDLIVYFCIGLFLLITVVNWAVWSDVKSPAVLHSLLWLTIVLLHTFVPHGLNALNLQTYSIIIGSMLMFSCGSIFGYSLIPVGDVMQVPKPVSPNGRVVSLYFYIAVIGLPFMIIKALDLASQTTTDNFLINLRTTLTREDNPQGYGVISYFLPVAYSYFFFCLADKNKPLSSKDILFPLAICLVYATLSTGRTFLFLLFLPALFILSFSRTGFLTLPKALLFFAILLLSFWAIGALLGKLGSDERSALSVFLLYLLGGITAFQQLISADTYLEYGAHTFRTVYAVFAALGFDVEVKRLIQEYAYVPGPTNVYTVFQPYFVDFGIFFALFMQFLLGAMHSILYKFSKRQDTRAVLLYSLSIYPLFMQWFQDQYFMLLSMWILFGLLLLLPFIQMTAHSHRRRLVWRDS